MAIPANPSVGSRALYYPYAVPAPVTTAVLGTSTTTPSIVPLDCGPGNGQPLPAIVLSVAGASPDYLGMVLLVYTPAGGIVLRTGTISSATWVTNGSLPTVARWVLVDTTT